MGTDCVSSCCRFDSILFHEFALSRDNQADIVETFKSTSRYLDDLLNIDNGHFEKKNG